MIESALGSDKYLENELIFWRSLQYYSTSKWRKSIVSIFRSTLCWVILISLNIPPINSYGTIGNGTKFEPKTSARLLRLPFTGKAWSRFFRTGLGEAYVEVWRGLSRRSGAVSWREWNKLIEIWVHQELSKCQASQAAFRNVLKWPRSHIRILLRGVWSLRVANSEFGCLL